MNEHKHNKWKLSLGTFLHLGVGFDDKSFYLLFLHFGFSAKKSFVKRKCAAKEAEM